MEKDSLPHRKNPRDGRELNINVTSFCHHGCEPTQDILANDTRCIVSLSVSMGNVILKGKFPSKKRPREMSETRLCYVNLLPYPRTSDSLCSNTKIAKPDDVRKHSLTICVGRAERNFLQLIFIYFPSFIALDPPKRTFRCVWLVVEEKGNTGVAQRLQTVRDTRP